MDRDTVIALARETELWEMLEGYSSEYVSGNTEEDCLPTLERFAALVAAEKDKEIKMLAKALKAEQKKNKELISVMSGSVEIAVRLAVKAEREECARIVDQANVSIDTTFTAVAAAIRSRT